ncbi:hypothetical protein C0991_009002, partial [Blastosporella zonata]
IAGGFAPPIPDAIYTIDKASDTSQLFVQSQIRPDGTPDLQLAPSQSLSAEDHDVLITKLHNILKDLPTEQPPGSQDIYGLNTSIAWMSDDLEWYNGGPAGCGGGESFVQPTEEQKANFKTAVDIIHAVMGNA